MPTKLYHWLLRVDNWSLVNDRQLIDLARQLTNHHEPAVLLDNWWNFHVPLPETSYQNQGPKGLYRDKIRERSRLIHELRVMVPPEIFCSGAQDDFKATWWLILVPALRFGRREGKGKEQKVKPWAAMGFGSLQSSQGRRLRSEQTLIKIVEMQRCQGRTEMAFKHKIFQS